jgi:opacity protein-like surface antigen
MRLWFLLMAGGVTAFSQPFGFGVRAGVPLNDFVSTVKSPNFGFNSTTNRYIIGPMAELRLPFGLGVEVDALYRHFNFRGTAPSPITGTTLFTSANSGAWEFPLLAKFRFPSKVIRPYVDGGVAWDTLTGLEQSVTSVVPVPPVIANALVRHNTTSGFVVGAGLDVHALIIHLQPEVRYTRWGAQHFLDPNGGFSSNQNQAEFLLGITF